MPSREWKTKGHLAFADSCSGQTTDSRKDDPNHLFPQRSPFFIWTFVKLKACMWRRMLRSRKGQKRPTLRTTAFPGCLSGDRQKTRPFHIHLQDLLLLSSAAWWGQKAAQKLKRGGFEQASMKKGQKKRIECLLFFFFGFSLRWGLHGLLAAAKCMRVRPLFRKGHDLNWWRLWTSTTHKPLKDRATLVDSGISIHVVPPSWQFRV